MPLTVMVHLRGNAYEAGGERPSEGEWPPHPARVFCALAASAQSEAEWDALRWLEEQAPPQVWADQMERVQVRRSSGYVVQNSVKLGGGNLNWPGRTNGSRARSYVVPTSDWFAIVWPEADPRPETVNLLNLLAWKVPYVGRSTSRAQLSVAASLPQVAHGEMIYELVNAGNGRSYDLRIPYPGYVDALRTAYAAGVRSWEVARARPYRQVDGAVKGTTVSEESPATQGPFEELLVWTIERPVTRIGGDQTVALASSLRKAVMSRVPEPVPPQVSGHTEPGRQHVAFLALPDVGHRHADGHVLGLALAIPRGLPQPHMTVLLRALIVEPGLTKVCIPGGRVLAVRYGADRSGIRPMRWSSSNGGGEREWVTVTPMMLDGHTRRGRDEAREVARALVIAGYPRPAEVDVSAAPMVAGGVWRPRTGTMPSGRPHRQLVHAQVRFDEPVIGPVLAGSMRYLGLGLFRPVARDESDRSNGRSAGNTRRDQVESQAVAAVSR